jgi:hypothetical protein
MIKQFEWLKLYLVFLLLFFIQFLISLYINNWNFAYPLDDPYIHLAIAKNFSEHGIWGATQFEFSSTSSSLLFTVLIFVFFFIGLKTVLLSLIINILSVAILFFAIQKIAEKENWSKTTYYLINLSVLLFAPVIAIVLTGMEHILHIILSFVLFYYSAKLISDEYDIKDILFVTLLACFGSSIRYESLFIIFAVGLLLFLKKRFIPFIFLLIGALLPIIIFGLISLQHGQHFLPNTLLSKGHAPEWDIISLLNQSILWIKRVFIYPHILSCFVILIFGLFQISKYERNLSNKWFVYLILVIISFILHLTFAGVGWFFRYEAYLIVATLLSSGIIINKYLKKYQKLKEFILSKKLAFIVGLIIITPLFYRSLVSFYKSSYAPKNIYEQQVQMAKFISKYNYRSVMINDIGAVCYYNNVMITDLGGLATKEILEERKIIQKDSLLDLLIGKNKCEIAIIHEGIINQPYPEEWRKAGEWQISNNVICWKDKISFYSLDSRNYAELKNNLKEYSSELPSDVIMINN